MELAPGAAPVVRDGGRRSDSLPKFVAIPVCRAPVVGTAGRFVQIVAASNPLYGLPGTATATIIDDPVADPCASDVALGCASPGCASTGTSIMLVDS